ncbi:MAG: molybdopterin-dependent oxidoreductase [Proteobacteria bacterium]|nr:molybdopterin-dependent oxidoreductase [Pseudomonadota bacterium]
MPVTKGEYQVFRNACPRNCYDTCSMQTYVKDQRIQFVEGAPESSFTDGGLCVKGYSYVQQVYAKDRITHPLRQVPRGSGHWERISWDTALETIARKIREIEEKDGSLHGLCLATGSGNHGITNNSPDGMMSSLGYTTRTRGTPCWPAGIDAQAYDMGEMWCNDPEDLVKSRYIILWGVNPAWCSIHSMKFIYEARERGARIIVIDPLFTQTAAKADLYCQVKAGTDGILALGMARVIIEEGLTDPDFLSNHTLGYERFTAYLDQQICLAQVSEICGIPESEIRSMARDFASIKPATIWVGYGMQRHTNGGANVRAIDALGALTGNIGKPGGGVRYGHKTNRIFNYYAASMSPPQGAGPGKDRFINTNRLAQEILDAENPPIRMLWNTCRNPFSQDFNRPLLERAFKKLELVVCVEQFMTMTCEQADIVLPVTTLFEEDTINVAYWHYWLALNEKAIAPVGECRSNTRIAMDLSEKMNQLFPGSCTFPTHLTSEEWISREFNDRVYEMFGITSWKDLKSGPVKAVIPREAWGDGRFATPSGKYEFYSKLAQSHGHKALPEVVPGRKPSAPFRILTPHSKFSIHSQFQNLDYMTAFNPEPCVRIHPKAAAQKGICDKDLVRVFNDQGQIVVRSRLTTTVPQDTLVLHEAWFKNKGYCVQNLVDDQSSDMGVFKTGSPGVAIHDQFADIEKISPAARRFPFNFWKTR